MATQTRRRILAILFAVVLAVPAVPVIASPPDHAKAHGHNKAEEVAQPAQSADPTQSTGKTNQSEGTSELCKDVFPEENTTSATSVSIAGAELSWSGSILEYTVAEGYELEICLKSGTVIDLFGPFGQGTGSVSTESGKNISHIGYFLTEVSPEPPADTPADETPVDETPVDETPADETPGDGAPADETPGDETPVDETPVDEGTPTTVPSDNRDTSDQTPDAEETPAETVPESAPQDQQPDPQQFAESDTQVAGLVITAPPAGPDAAAVVTPAVDTPAATNPATEVAASTVASSSVTAAPATLPFTGFESNLWAALGAAILAAGAALLLAGREPHVGRHEVR